MSRTIALVVLLLLGCMSTAIAQNEFPWQGGRVAAPKPAALIAAMPVVRLAAPDHRDGAVTVLLYDYSGQLRAHLRGMVRNSEVILSLPGNLSGGVYMYRILSSAAHTEGKLIVPRRA
jgi:hypothetical protein